MHWIFLILAGAFEIGFTACLKMSNGFTRLWWSLAFVLFAGISFLFLNLSIAVIPLGTAYAIWTGIGAAGTTVVGMVAFQEPRRGRESSLFLRWQWPSSASRWCPNHNRNPARQREFDVQRASRILLTRLPSL